jgi:hypothetical protein
MEYNATHLDELFIIVATIGLVIALFVYDNDWWRKM